MATRFLAIDLVERPVSLTQARKARRFTLSTFETLESLSPSDDLKIDPNHGVGLDRILGKPLFNDEVMKKLIQHCLNSPMSSEIKSRGRDPLL